MYGIRKEEHVKYAIFGATGAVGKVLAPILATADQPFRVVGRSEEHLRRDFQRYGPLAELCPADLGDPEGAARAAQGVDTVFYLVGVPYPQFELHPKLSRVALDAAAAAGVRRFVHLGTVYPFGMPRTARVSESHSREPHTFKGKMRKEQEDLVIAADGQSGMRTTILRAPDFYGPTSELSFVQAIFKAAVEGGTADVIGPIDTPHEFIFVPDVAQTLYELSKKDEAYGQTWNLGGPGLISTREFAERVFGMVEEKPRLRVANKMMLRIMGLFVPLLREVVEMHYLWTTPVAIDDTRLRALLPDLRRTSYEDGIAATLRAMQGKVAKAAAV